MGRERGSEIHAPADVHRPGGCRRRDRLRNRGDRREVDRMGRPHLGNEPIDMLRVPDIERADRAPRREALRRRSVGRNHDLVPGPAVALKCAHEMLTDEPGAAGD